MIYIIAFFAFFAGYCFMYSSELSFNVKKNTLKLNECLNCPLNIMSFFFRQNEKAVKEMLAKALITRQVKQ
ncbi:hypothetical protein M0R19_03685 [Candidatus Pacearchaeota archaeon]|jgi:hypothetical protein|nr:hypothetical protein [Candidatus Pacearchaeota archaeon]